MNRLSNRPDFVGITPILLENTEATSLGIEKKPPILMCLSAPTNNVGVPRNLFQYPFLWKTSLK